MGRIEHTLVDEGRASSPTDLRPPPATTSYHNKVTNVSSHKKAEIPKGPRPGKHFLDKPQYQIDQHYDDDHSYNDADGAPRHPHLLPLLLASLRPTPRRIAQGPE